MKRTIILVIGWLAAYFILYAALMQIYVGLNLFDWQPKWDWRFPISGFCILASIVASWFLARAAHDRFSLIASFVVSLISVVFALFILPAEQIDTSKESGFLAGSYVRHSVSPLWFRGGIAAFMALPAAIWIGWLLWHRRHSHTSQKYEN